MINSLELKGKDLIFIQFSFLDRIGHRIGFKNDVVIKKCYHLAYSIIDKLYEMIDPEYLIVVSDHGFDPNKLNHVYRYGAVLILNEAANKYFNENVPTLNKISDIIINIKSLFNYLFHRQISKFVACVHAIYFQIKILNINYITQTLIFDKILEMFNIHFIKPVKIKKKKKERRKLDICMKKKIEKRLKVLGYIN